MSPSPDVLEDRLRRLGDAVAETTVATTRSFDGVVDLGVDGDDGRGGRVSALLVAAAVVLALALISAIVTVAVVHDRDGNVTTNDTTPGTQLVVGGDLPRLVPTGANLGFELDAAEVHDGGPPPVTWVRKFYATAASGDVRAGDALSIRVATPAEGRRLEPPITNPNVSKAVDVNGRPGWINYALAPGADASSPRTGVSVVWTDVAGHRLDLDTVGWTEADATALAGAVRVGGSPDAPTADVDRSALPAAYTETYAGPDFTPIQYAGPDDHAGWITLALLPTAPQPYRDTSRPNSPTVVVNEFALPAGEADRWLHSFGPSSTTFTGDGMSFVMRPIQTGSWEVVGAGHGALVSLRGDSPTGAEVRSVAAALHPVGADDWRSYLASAASRPYPTRTEAPGDVPACATLRVLQAESQPTPSSTGGLHHPTADELTTLAARLPAEAAAVQTVIDGWRAAETRQAQIDATTTIPFTPPTPMSMAPLFDHDQTVALRHAEQQVDGWARSHCAAQDENPVSAEFLVYGLTNLGPQDPALDDFCRAVQPLDFGDPSDPAGSFHLTSAADQLDAVIPRLPSTAPDLVRAATELRDRMREVPDGEAPKMRSNDPLGTDRAKLVNACPDWPR